MKASKYDSWFENKGKNYLSIKCWFYKEGTKAMNPKDVTHERRRDTS